MGKIIQGDALQRLAELPPDSVQCVVTSPPYWGLRDYGVEGQLGLEPAMDDYISAMVRVFAEVRRVLRPDGVLWLNIGDSYSAGGMSNPSNSSTLGGGKDRGAGEYSISHKSSGLPPKNLCMIPARLALAMQDDGWILRSEIVWHKPNPMPESVTDRPTKVHEMIYMFAKSPRYFWDADAVREEYAREYRDGPGFGGLANRENTKSAKLTAAMPHLNRSGVGPNAKVRDGRNIRGVWTIATRPLPEAHFAAFPPDLVERCIKAGSRPADVVLDPFGGAGTVAMVAESLGRQWITIELNPEYVEIIKRRVSGPLFAGTV